MLEDKLAERSSTGKRKSSSQNHGTKRTRTTGQYASKIGGLRQETDYVQFLRWTTEAGLELGNQELLRKQSKNVEALVKVLKETFDSKKARHGLSLDAADFVAREAGFREGREVTEARGQGGSMLGGKDAREVHVQGRSGTRKEVVDHRRQLYPSPTYFIPSP